MIGLKLIQNGDKCVLFLARLCFQDGVTALTTTQLDTHLQMFSTPTYESKNLLEHCWLTSFNFVRKKVKRVSLDNR